MSVYDKLTEEIQIMIAQLIDNPSDIVESMLVCKRWHSIFQKELYRLVEIDENPNLTKFVDTLEKNPHLGSLVKDFVLLISNDYNDYNENSTIIKSLALLPNLEYITCAVGIYIYRIILDALLLNQLPFLNYLEPPEERLCDRDIHDYNSCTIILRDRLKNLKISDEVAEELKEIPHQTEDQGRFYRIYDMLDKYKKLERLRLVKKTDNKIKWIENATRICPIITQLAVQFNPDNNINQVYFIDIHAATSGPIPVSNNITHFEYVGVISGDPQLIYYIIYKFPNLKELIINDKTDSPNYADKSTFSKLLKHLLNIKHVRVFGIPWKNQIHQESIGSFLEVASRSLTLSVGIGYCYTSSISDRLHVTIKDGLCKVFFMMKSMMGVSFILRNGHCIDHLTLDVRKWNAQPNINHKIHNSILLQSLQSCVKLKRLEISDLIMDISNSSNTAPLQKNLNLLRLKECTIQMQEGLTPLLDLFASIKRLELRGIKYANPVIDNDGVYSNIAKTETAINTLSISKEVYYWTPREHIFLLKLSLQQQECRYYLYNFRTMNDLVFKPVMEEMYTEGCAQQGCLIIDVSCKSVNMIEVVHGLKKVKLNLI